jgi:hypothetical protein
MQTPTRRLLTRQMAVLFAVILLITAIMVVPIIWWNAIYTQ